MVTESNRGFILQGCRTSSHLLDAYRVYRTGTSMTIDQHRPPEVVQYDVP